MALQGHPKSLILAPIESAYAISYWSTIVTLVLPFQRYCRFPEKSDPTPFHPNFMGVPFGLDCRCCGSYRSEDPKLVIRLINFELVQPICQRYINVTDRQTDGQTTYDSNTALALHASRGKKWVGCETRWLCTVCSPQYETQITNFVSSTFPTTRTYRESAEYVLLISKI